MSTSSTPATLPRCLWLVNHSAERLHSLTMPRSSRGVDLPLFPIVSCDPRTLENLQVVVQQGIAWQVAMFFAYGTLTASEMNQSKEVEEAAGVLNNFWPADGPFGAEHPSFFLGPLPLQLRTNAAAFKQLAPAPFLYALDGYTQIATTLTNWPTIKETLIVRHRIVVSRALALVGWVQTAIRTFLAPPFRIVDVDAQPRGGRRVRVVVETLERDVVLTSTEHALLIDLASNEQVRSTRKIKMGLVGKIPELDPRICAVNHDARKADSEAHYAMDAETRAVVLQRG